MNKTDTPEGVVDVASWKDAKELDDFGENLTQWEIDFLESIMQQMKAGRSLSAAQCSKLESIRGERL